MEESMVLRTVEPRLAALGPIAAELNRATDAFTAELAEIESRLAEMNLGVTVEDAAQPMHQTHAPEAGKRQFFLAYGRAADDSWRLLVREYEVTAENQWGEPTDWTLRNEKPLLESSREIRMAAAERIDSLINKITDTAQTKLQSLKDRTDK
jgi:hypothetical protein